MPRNGLCWPASAAGRPTSAAGRPTSSAPCRRRAPGTSPGLRPQAATANHPNMRTSHTHTHTHPLHLPALPRTAPLPSSLLTCTPWPSGTARLPPRPGPAVPPDACCARTRRQATPAMPGRAQPRQRRRPGQGGGVGRAARATGGHCLMQVLAVSYTKLRPGMGPPAPRRLGLRTGVEPVAVSPRRGTHPSSLQHCMHAPRHQARALHHLPTYPPYSRVPGDGVGLAHLRTRRSSPVVRAGAEQVSPQHAAA